MKNTCQDVSKRQFIKLASLLGATAVFTPLDALMLPESAMAEVMVPLRLHNPHTDENYEIELFNGSEWNRWGVLACDYMLRDWRQKQVVTCDRKLYAALYVIQRKFNIEGHISINSGFRSKETNAMLRAASIRRNGGKTSWGTPALHSQHTLAKAVDFALPGVPAPTVAAYVESLQLGGTGNYSTFTHMDTGSVRRWGPEF